MCLDVNECLANNGHGPCQGTCRNLAGSYECSCADIPGYKLAVDNHTCEDVDECAVNNANCSHLCLNTPGSAFCFCPIGFYLADDWKTCQGTASFLSLSPSVIFDRPSRRITRIQSPIFNFMKLFSILSNPRLCFFSQECNYFSSLFVQTAESIFPWSNISSLFSFI